MINAVLVLPQSRVLNEVLVLSQLFESGLQHKHKVELTVGCVWSQKAHLAMIDALMTLGAKETVSRVKMAVEAEQMGVGAPWENALLFWVNRVRGQHTNDLFTYITAQH